VFINDERFNMRNTAFHHNKMVKLLEKYVSKSGDTHYMIILGEYPVWVDESALSSINFDSLQEIKKIEPNSEEIDPSKFSLTQLEYFVEYGLLPYNRYMEEVQRRRPNT